MALKRQAATHSQGDLEIQDQILKIGIIYISICF